MDAKLEALYFPLGRDGDRGEEGQEEADQTVMQSIGEEDEAEELDCSDPDAHLLRENEDEMASVLLAMRTVR
jgi:hypothetical protein